MSEEFFPGLDKFEADRAKKRGESYEKKVLKKIIKWMDSDALKRLQHEAGEDFGLDWFIDTQHPPVLLNAEKLSGITLAALLYTGFLNSKLARAFFSVYESYGAEAIGKPIALIFPIDGSDWVITDMQLEVRGANFVQRHGNSDDVPSLAILRLQDFVDGLKRQYVLP